MSGYPRLDETGLNTLTQALADATKLQGVIKVCETEAEWNQKTQAEKDDPNIYWFLPWRTSTSGEINDNTIAPDKVWSSQKVNSENTALKAMVTDDYVFSPSKAYAAGDWLIHNNILYEVLVACTGVTPPNATYYKVKNLHDLQSEIDALKSVTSNITYRNSGISGVTAAKIGNIVQLIFYMPTAITAPSSGWVTVGTLSKPFCPYHTMSCNLMDNSATSRQNMSILINILGSVESNSAGFVQWYAFAANETVKVRGTVTFIAKDASTS